VKKSLAVALILGVTLAYSFGRGDDMGQKAKTVTLTGTLVDVACYLDDGDSGNDHMGMKGCGTECLKGGSPAGLLVDKNLYVLVFPASAFADYVGKKVEISGDEYGMNLIPKKASQVNSDGSKKAINIKGKAMM
jgi:type 1 fimbria pilin